MMKAVDAPARRFSFLPMDHDVRSHQGAAYSRQSNVGPAIPVDDDRGVYDEDSTGDSARHVR